MTMSLPIVPLGIPEELVAIFGEYHPRNTSFARIDPTPMPFS